MCRKLDLFPEAFVAIDGSKFKAVNSRDRNFTSNKIKSRPKQIDASIEAYLVEMASADRLETSAGKNKSERIQDKIAKLKKEIAYLNDMDSAAQATPGKQISLTDPDARAMATANPTKGMVGYNVQTAVDVENHLIVAHKVTNISHDRYQLTNMAEQATFGTIKSWMGSTHFRLKTLERVSSEMSLHVLAYNLKRVMQIMGVGPLLAAIEA